jgi:hypothetical protein
MPWQNKPTTVAGGLAVVLMLVGSVVARADNPGACVDCRNYWGWWAAHTPMVQGGCQNHPHVNQSNNMGACIAYVQNANCGALCAANPPTVPVASCDGEPGVKEACATATQNGCSDPEEASGPCNQGCWDAQCEASWLGSSKRCRLKQVNQDCRPLGSVCYANCECQLTP